MPDENAKLRGKRRDQILDAAEEIVSELGFESLTMIAVARRAELSKGTLYLYFENKDSLCAAVAERHLSQASATLQTLAESEACGRDVLISMVRHKINEFITHPSRFEFMLSWHSSAVYESGLCSYMDAYHARIERHHQLLNQIIDRGKSDGSILSPLSGRELGFQLWSSTVGVTMMIHHQDRACPNQLRLPTQTLIENHLHAICALLCSGEKYECCT